MAAAELLRRSLAAATMVFAIGWSGQALAQAAGSIGDAAGFYADIGAGAVLHGDDKIKGGGTDVDAVHDWGTALRGGVGIRFPSGLRLEFDSGYRRTTVDKAGIDAKGSASATNFGVNALYDIHTHSPFTPYFGVGVGGAVVGYGNVALPGGNRLNDQGLTFAYQGIVGVATALTERLQVTLDYRYLGTLATPMTTALGTRVDADYHAHTIMVGLRWLFWPTGRAETVQAPPPPPAPPPAIQPAAATPPPPPATRDYVVFFDFDSAAITPAAEGVLQQAAAAIKRYQPTRITVTGHTDLAGPEPYNVQLSIRRAAAVKAELVQLGVAGDAVEVIGRGEADPRVPTPIGVREPQNRRAEIVF